MYGLNKKDFIFIIFQLQNRNTLVIEDMDNDLTYDLDTSTNQIIQGVSNDCIYRVALSTKEFFNKVKECFNNNKWFIGTGNSNIPYNKAKYDFYNYLYSFVGYSSPVTISKMFNKIYNTYTLLNLIKDINPFSIRVPLIDIFTSTGEQEDYLYKHFELTDIEKSIFKEFYRYLSVNEILIEGIINILINIKEMEKYITKESKKAAIRELVFSLMYSLSERLRVNDSKIYYSTIIEIFCKCFKEYLDKILIEEDSSSRESIYSLIKDITENIFNNISNYVYSRSNEDIAMLRLLCLLLVISPIKVNSLLSKEDFPLVNINGKNILFLTYSIVKDYDYRNTMLILNNVYKKYSELIDFIVMAYDSIGKKGYTLDISSINHDSYLNLFKNKEVYKILQDYYPNVIAISNSSNLL